MRYITVGTSELSKERFINVEDTEPDNLKPRGGRWFTRHDEEYDDYNEWVDFIIENPRLLVYKSKGSSIWEQPCAVASLNEDANIYTLDSNIKLDELRREYPLDNNKFSYVAMSHDFDGIFIDLNKMRRTIDDLDTRSKLSRFGVSSLVLFNYDCIKEYQSGIVLIEPFDFEYEYNEGTTYKIICDDIKKKVLRK